MSATKLSITAGDSTGRLARINTRKMFIRTPHPLASAGAMAQGLTAPGVQMSLLNGSGGTTNMGKDMGHGPQSDSLDPFDRDLHTRIMLLSAFSSTCKVPRFVDFRTAH